MSQINCKLAVYTSYSSSLCWAATIELLVDCQASTALIVLQEWVAKACDPKLNTRKDCRGRRNDNFPPNKLYANKVTILMVIIDLLVLSVLSKVEQSLFVWDFKLVVLDVATSERIVVFLSSRKKNNHNKQVSNKNHQAVNWTIFNIQGTAHYLVFWHLLARWCNQATITCLGR